MEIIKMKTKALSLSLSIMYFMMELNQRSIQAVDLKITNENSWDLTILKIEITIKRRRDSENRNYNKEKKRYKHHNKLTSSHTKFSKIDS